MNQEHLMKFTLRQMEQEGKRTVKNRKNLYPNIVTDSFNKLLFYIKFKLNEKRGR